MKKAKIVDRSNKDKEKYKEEIVELRDEKVELDTDTDGANNDDYDEEECIEENINELDIEDDDTDIENNVEDEEIVDVDEPVYKDSKKANKKLKKKGEFAITLIKCAIIVIIICGVILGGYFVFQNYLGVVITMEGDVMKPNIKSGETVVASRLVKPEDIKRNDIVVFEKKGKEGKYYMRRVLGLPGEKVEIKDGDVYINDKKIKDPYRGEKSIYGIIEKDSIKLGKKEFFVLCDHRPNIDDSRMSEVGPVKSKEIIAVKRAK